MGMLGTAILQGASQGLNVLGQGMMRDIAQGQEQSIWEKRQAMLSQIQRENAQVARDDQAAFDDARLPTKIEQEGMITAARGQAQQASDLSRLTNPELQAALKAAEASKNTAALEQLRQEVKIRGDGAIRVANATRDPGNGAGSSAVKIAEDERILGRKLTQEELMAKLGYGRKEGKPDATETEAVKSIFKRYENGEITGEQTGVELSKIKRSLSGEAPAPPAAAVDMLRKNPDLASDFDAKYGIGASERVLSQKPSGQPQRTERAGMLPPAATSQKQTARAEYLRELKILEDMKGSIFMPTPRGSEHQLAQQEAKVNRLLQAAQ